MHAVSRTRSVCVWNNRRRRFERDIYMKRSWAINCDEIIYAGGMTASSHMSANSAASLYIRL